MAIQCAKNVHVTIVGKEKHGGDYVSWYPCRLAFEQDTRYQGNNFKNQTSAETVSESITEDDNEINELRRKYSRFNTNSSSSDNDKNSKTLLLLKSQIVQTGK